MANHVYSNIQITPSNEAGVAKLKEIFQRAKDRPESDGNLWFGYLFVDGKEGSPIEEDVFQYSWTLEHIGPKWCHIEDIDEMDDEIQFRTESAWVQPEKGLVKILEEIEQVDPKVRAKMTYDDEMPNFVGWSVYVGSELEDGSEWDDEEIRDEIFHAYPHLKEYWDEDADEWATDEDGDMTEEANAAVDEYREVMYEVISNRFDDDIDECLKWLDEQKEEEE
tara:strand:+ start:7130 stop:7795 length:666 start_codon:yes stop_codon:yes gene_type:complete